MNRAISLLFVLSLCCALLSGCWDSQELATLSFVAGIGIDKAKSPGYVDLIVQINKVEDKNAGGGSDEKNYLTRHKTTDNIFNGIRDFSHDNSRRLFLEHNQVLVFGKELAKEGVMDHIDFFMRDHETRMETWVFVADGTALDILNTESKLEKVPALGLSRMLQNQSATSETIGVHLLEFATGLQSKTSAVLAPMVRSKTTDGDVFLNMGGMAVFKDGVYVGELDKVKTRGYAWITDKVKSGSLHVGTPEDSACIEIKQTKTKLTPKIEADESISMHLKINMTGIISEQTGFSDIPIDQLIPMLEKETQKLIEREVFKALQEARVLKADFLGFGQAVERKYNKHWKSVEQDWDEVFPNVPLIVEPEVIIQGTWRINKSLVQAKEMNKE